VSLSRSFRKGAVVDDRIAGGVLPSAGAPEERLLGRSRIRSGRLLVSGETTGAQETTKMRLEIGNGQILENPTADQISGVLHALPGGDTHSLAILIRDDWQLMQCSGGWKEGFVLEYQDGSADEHFQCSDRRLPLADVIGAFQAYLADDDRWRTMFCWRKIDIRRRWWRWW